LAAYFGVEFGSPRHPSTRVNHTEFLANPLNVALKAVAGDTRLILDNCNLGAQKPIEESALTHIGSSDDHYGWQSLSHVCIVQAVYARTMSTKVNL
jgi:hypothetical protein